MMAWRWHWEARLSSVGGELEVICAYCGGIESPEASSCSKLSSAACMAVMISSITPWPFNRPAVSPGVAFANTMPATFLGDYAGRHSGGALIAAHWRGV